MTFLKMTILNVKSVILCEYALIYMEFFSYQLLYIYHMYVYQTSASWILPICCINCYHIIFTL